MKIEYAVSQQVVSLFKEKLVRELICSRFYSFTFWPLEHITALNNVSMPVQKMIVTNIIYTSYFRVVDVAVTGMLWMYPLEACLYYINL